MDWNGVVSDEGDGASVEVPEEVFKVGNALILLCELDAFLLGVWPVFTGQHGLEDVALSDQEELVSIELEAAVDSELDVAEVFVVEKVLKEFSKFMEMIQTV